MDLTKIGNMLFIAIIYKKTKKIPKKGTFFILPINRNLS